MSALRDRTAGAHQRLHRLEPFARLLAGTIAADAYLRLMTRMLDFYRHFDPLALDGIGRFRELTAPYVYQPRAPRIAGELDTPLSPATREGAAGWGLKPADSAARLGGMLYVVDGAMLGGALLARHAGRIGGAGEGHWQWCRMQGGAQWQSTRSLLTRLAARGCATDEIVEAASATFAAFGSCMEGGMRPAVATADRT